MLPRKLEKSMKTESKIAGLTMALALSAASVAQGATVENDIHLLKSLRSQQAKAVPVSEARAQASGAFYQCDTDRITNDGGYLGDTDRIV